MRSLSLILCLFPSLLLAQESCPTQDPSKGLASNVQAIVSQTLPTCGPEDSEAFKEFSTLFASNKKIKKKKILDLELEGEAELLDLAQKMVTNPDYQGWKEKAVSCKDILCAFEKVLGSKDAAYRVFNMAKRNGYIIKLGPVFKEQDKNLIFTSREITLIDEAFKILPPELNALKNLGGYYRLPDDYVPLETRGAAAYAEVGKNNKGKVVFQDDAFRGGEDWARHATIHETCHHYDYKSVYSDGKLSSEKPSYGFMELSGWTKVVLGGSLNWSHKDNAQFVTYYAATQPAEDFAETCAFYVRDPQALKARAPEKYTFMKDKVFGGKEFPGFNATRVLEKNFEDPVGCSAYLSSCLEKLRFTPEEIELEGKSYKYNKGVSALSTATLRNSECYKTERQKKITQITVELSQQREVFCRYGGEKAIAEKLEANFCKNNFEEILAFAGETSKRFSDMKFAYILECDKKENRSECIRHYIENKTPYNFKGLSPEMKTIIYNKILNLKD